MAGAADVPVLAAMNLRLTKDEDHPNKVRSIPWFEERMRGFLAGEYKAVLYLLEGEPAGYALYAAEDEISGGIHLRQLYVERGLRRRGIGREMIRILREKFWPAGRRITLGVMTGNIPAIAFYRALGFREYAVEMEIPAEKG
jgi:ribosomal protein S18 acetylase RimI-like enzyme